MRKKKNLSVIYENALELFAEKGFQKTTLDDISKKLNMTNGNLYSYASNKLELYQKTVSYALSQWQKEVFEALKDVKTTKEFLTKGCRTSLSRLKKNSNLCAILKKDLNVYTLPKAVDPYRSVDQVAIDKICEMLELGVANKEVREIDCKVFAELTFEAFKAIVFRTLFINDDAISFGMVDKFVDVFVSGLMQ